MSNTLVDIHSPGMKPEDAANIAPNAQGEYIDGKLTSWDRPQIALAMQERGLETVFTRGKAAFNFDSGQATILRPKIEKIDGIYRVTVRPEAIAIDAIHAIRNMHLPLGHGLPELNHPSVRDITREKTVTNELLAELGLVKEYAEVEPGADISPVLEQMAAKEVVLKPNKGSRGNNVHVGWKADIERQFNSGRIDRKIAWILEEKLDMTAPIRVRALDDEDQHFIDNANRFNLPRELRVLTFGRRDDGSLITGQVLRVGAAGKIDMATEHWIPVNPDTIPPEVIQKTDEIERKFESKTGVKEIHLAVDWALVANKAEGQPKWLPIEINSGNPALVGEHMNAAVGKEQAGLMADQLYRVAQKRSVM